MASNFDERVRLGLIRQYSLDELKDLCQDLKVNYETLKHDTLNNLARELIRYMARRNRLPELIKRLRRERPTYTWPDPPPSPMPGPRSAKLAAYLGGSRLPALPGGRARKPTTRSSTRSNRRSTKSRPGYDPRLIRFGLLILFAVILAVGISLVLPDENRPAIQSEQSSAVLSPDSAVNPTFLRSWGWGIVNDAAFSPDGRLVAVASTSRVMLYDASSLDYRKDFPTELAAATSVAFSSDSRKLAAGLVDGSVMVWSLDGGDERPNHDVHTSEISDLVFMPDGDKLLIGFDDGSVRLWSVSSGEMDVLAEGIGRVYGVAVSVNGLTLAAVGADGNIRLWDALSTAPPRSWPGHPGAIIRTVAFAPDGTRLATAGDDGVSNVWSTVDGLRLATTPKSGATIHTIAYSPDGTSLALGLDDGSVRLWTPVDGAAFTSLSNAERPPHAGAVKAVAYAPNGDTLLTASSDDTVQLWRAETGQQLHDLRHFLGWVYDVDFAPDDSYVAAALSSTYVERPMLTEVEAKNRLADHTAAVRSLDFAPNGLTMATGGADQRLIIWNADTGVPRECPGHTGVVNSVAYSPDGETLASGSGDGSVSLWRVADCSSLVRWVTDGHPVWQVAFSADGRLLAAALDSGEIRVWDVITGQVVHSFTSQPPAPVRGVAFSPNRLVLAAAWEGGSVELWPLSGGPPRHLPTPNAKPTSVAFSPDGQLLAVGLGINERNGKAQLWSVADDRLLKDFADSRAPVTSVAFSHDGTRLVTGGMDGLVQVWSVVATGMTEQ